MRALTALCLLLVAADAPAETWRWVDEGGKVHYSDTPPAGREAEQIELPDDDTLPDSEAAERRRKALEILKEDSEREHLQEEAASRRREAERRQECNRRRRELIELEQNPPLMRRDFPGLLREEYLEHERNKRIIREWLKDNCPTNP